MKQIPNLFTLFNLFFGCLAIVSVLQSGLEPMFDSNGIAVTNEFGIQYLQLPAEIWMASLFIGIAALVDFLDGFIARIFNASSEMGKQLDSLADVVSFGVAPAMIIYQFLRLSFAQEQDGLNTAIIWLLPAFILPCAAAYRLARFNLDTTQSHSFKGMPVPAAGIFIASLPVIFWNVDQEWIRQLTLNKWFLYGVVFILSALMVSKLPLMAMKFKNFGIKDNLPKYLLVIIAIATFLFVKWLAIPIVILAYVLISLLFKNKIA